MGGNNPTMKRKLIFGAYFLALFITSCKKIGTKSQNNNPTIATTTFPSYFSWQNSRNLKLTLNVTDLQFGELRHIICIYDGDPAAGGNLLTKGSASTKLAFVTTVYLTANIKSIYIVKSAPNNSKSIQKVDAGGSDITVSLPGRINTPILATDKIPSHFDL